MPKRVVQKEQMIAKVQQIEKALEQGKRVVTACREAGISEPSYYRWRKAYGQLAQPQATCLEN